MVKLCRRMEVLMTLRVAVFSLFSAVLISTSANAAAAQGDLPPRALVATTVTEADYPLRALAAAEQGRTIVNVAVAADGRMMDATVATSSGSQSLDQAAIQIAKSRWRFAPATRNGQPVAGTVPVEVNWTLPLQPAAQAYLQAPSLPNGAQPPRAARLVGQPGDYPSMSMEMGEQGVVGVRYLVRADGSIGDVQLAQSSGMSRLDGAALRLVRERWQTQPARVGGNAAEAWHTATVAFSLLPVNSYGIRQRCYEQPILGRDSALIAGELGFVMISELDMDRIMRWRVRPVGEYVGLWTQVSNAGGVSDALLETPRGWMRVTQPWARALTRDRRYPQSDGACWYYDPVAILG
jgi:TonB family protein